MSVMNSTYDIKWGKPDGTSLACGLEWPALPTCVNTSFPGYAGKTERENKRDKERQRETERDRERDSGRERDIDTRPQTLI